MKFFTVYPLLFLLLLTGASTAAESGDREFLLNFLTGFLDGASRNDAAVHEAFWAGDLVYTSSDGTRFGKAELMAGVREEGPQPISTDSVLYSAEDIQLRIYDDTAVVNFTLVASVDVGARVIGRYLNSGTFLKRDGRWQAVNWQATVTQTAPAEL